MIKMKKFKLEDYEGKFVMHVKTEEEYNTFSKFLDSKGETWNIDQSYMKIRHWDENTNNTCFCFNEGMYCNLEYFQNHDYTILEFSDFDWDKKGEEMKEFKVGDWVKSKCFSGVKKIKEIHCDFATTTDSCNYYLKDLELACEFTKGQEVECSNYENWAVTVGECKFVAFYPNKETPYLVEWESNNKIELFKHCRAIQHKYEPYTKFDPTWIGKDVCYNGEFMWTIVGRQKSNEVVLYNDEDGYTEQTFSQLFEYTWEETGKPFGKEIK